MSSTLGGLPEFQQKVTLRMPGVVQTPDASATAQAAGGLANSIDRALYPLERKLDAENAETKRNIDARARMDAGQAGASAVELGEDGMPRPPKLRGGASPTDMAYDVGATQTYQNGVESATQLKFQALRQQYRDDPVGFLGAARSMIEKMSPEFPEAMRGQLTVGLMRVAQGHGVGALKDFQQREYAMGATAFQNRVTTSEDEGSALAMAGEVGTPAWVSWTRRHDAVLQQGQTAGYINAELAGQSREALADRVTANGFAGQVENIARTQSPEAAERFMVEQLANPNLAQAGRSALAMAGAQGRARIDLVKQETTVARSQAGRTLTNVRNSALAGVTLTPGQVNQYANMAEDAKLPEIAREIRGIGVVQGEAKAWQQMSLPDLMASSVQATNADPSDPVADVRLRLLNHAITQRGEALKSDPVSFAQSQPAVKAAMARVASGEGTMSDVVQASDAVLASNGIDPIGHRIISVAQAKTLKDEVTNLPAAQAAEKLANLFQTYGPENRWRVWNDLRAADLPNNLRPVALLLASPDQGNAARSFLEFQRVGPEKLAASLPDTAAKDTREAVVAALQPLTETSSNTGQDAALMSDAQSAMHTLALGYAASMTPKDAAARAYREVVEGGLEIVKSEFGAYRVPKGVDYDGRAFEQAMGRLLGRGVSEVAPPVPGGEGIVSLATPGKTVPSAIEGVRFTIPNGAVSSALTPDEAQTAFRSSLKAFGRFRPSPDGMGVWLQDDKGRPVLTEDGRPYGVRFGDEKQLDRLPALQSYGGRARSTPEALAARLPAEWQPIVASAAAAEGVPVKLLGALIGQESGGRADARSRVGASGPAQAMAATARDPGFGVPPLAAADINNPAKAIPWAAKYLAAMHKEFGGDWGKALAAYNAGHVRVKAGGTLPMETQDYVATLLPAARG